MKIWYLYTVLTVVTWGLWGVFSKLASTYSKPKQALLFQTAGVLAFAVVVLLHGKISLRMVAAGLQLGRVWRISRIRRIPDVFRRA